VTTQCTSGRFPINCRASPCKILKIGSTMDLRVSLSSISGFPFLLGLDQLVGDILIMAQTNNLFKMRSDPGPNIFHLMQRGLSVSIFSAIRNDKFRDTEACLSEPSILRIADRARGEQHRAGARSRSLFARCDHWRGGSRVNRPPASSRRGRWRSA